MFTIEHIDEETVITVLDETAEFDDLNVIMTQSHVFLRQWCDTHNKHDVIVLTPQMYYKLMQAWNLPEGSYELEYEDPGDDFGEIQYGE